MGLRDLELKEEYRSDRDDMVKEFFIPCLDNCTKYDRAVEYIAVKSLTTFYFSLKNFIDNNPEFRIVTGHRLRTFDLNILANIVLPNIKLPFQVNGEKPKGYSTLTDMINSKKLQIKIAMPDSEEVYGSFGEKIGIFRDENDDVVAFTGTSNETFDPNTKNFESIDVFTSWNEKSRVETKIRDFENLWDNSTKNITVIDFADAIKDNKLQYSAEWVLGS